MVNGRIFRLLIIEKRYKHIERSDYIHPQTITVSNDSIQYYIISLFVTPLLKAEITVSAYFCFVRHLWHRQIVDDFDDALAKSMQDRYQTFDILLALNARFGQCIHYVRCRPVDVSLHLSVGTRH